MEGLGPRSQRGVSAGVVDDTGALTVSEQRRNLLRVELKGDWCGGAAYHEARLGVESWYWQDHPGCC